MIDHLGIAVSDLQKSRSFYEAALAPLGYGFVMEVAPEETGGAAYIAFGPPGKPAFWLGTGVTTKGNLHVAFAANDRTSVTKFYEAAINAGGRDNGAPGLRPEYHPNYFGAFVFDPDGHNVEAVCHAPGEFGDQFQD